MSVLVVVTTESETAPLMRWGYRFAVARNEPLVVLYPQVGSTPEESKVLSSDPSDNEPIIASLMRQAAEEIIQENSDTDSKEESPEPPSIVLKTVTHSDLPNALVREIRGLLASLLLLGKHEASKGEERIEAMIRKLFHRAPCDTMLMRLGNSDGKTCDRVLVPASGGPHANVALKLCENIIQNTESRLTALYVEPDLGEDSREVGKQIIRKTMRDAGVEPSNKIRPKVILADNIQNGIATEAHENYDLLVVGSSNVGFMRRTLFGTLPETLLAGEEPVAVAVVRRARSITAQIRDTIERWLDLTVPQLKRDERIDLFARIETGSRWGFDFMALICLSTSIASLGLIKDSAAVVIGAMLVAPLMTPLLGAGLGLVQGNLLMVRQAAKSIAYGFLLALIIGFGIGWITPMPSLTNELLSRGDPDLLDLGIAFLSGIAAAFAMGRPTLMAALPGVAIAAALVPPLATIGISLAAGEHKNAGNATMLFGTNVVAIILGAAFSLYAGGIRGSKGGTGRNQLWVRRSVMGLMLACAVLAVPLGSYLLSSITTQTITSAEIPEKMREEMDVYLKKETAGKIRSIKRNSFEADIEFHIILEVPRFPPVLTSTTELQNIAKRYFTSQVKVKVEPVLVITD